MLSHILVLTLTVAAAFALPGSTPVIEARQTPTIPEIGGGLAGTGGPFKGTAGGAINGPTGFVQGCLGGAAGPAGQTECFPVETAPPEKTDGGDLGGNAAGTLGPASAFLSYPGACGGVAYETNGFTYCLQSTATANPSA